MTSEERRIYELLNANIGNYVDSRRLSEIALQYPRVIKQLREHYGFTILNHVDRVGHKSIRGAYMLCSERQIMAYAVANRGKVLGARKAANNEPQPTLFDFGQRHHDE